MLGILFIYYIGRYFYTLAGRYQKNEWGFAIAGVLSYYGGQVVFAVLALLIVSYYTNQDIDFIDTSIVGK